MKTLKMSVVTLIITLMFAAGISTDVNAWPKVRVYVGTPRIGLTVVKPGPNYVWVEGHYKLNIYGKWLWVPGHWEKF